jgi:HK97 family phage major capsid protein
MSAVTVGHKRKAAAARLRGSQALEESKPKTPARREDSRATLEALRKERSDAATKYRELSETHYAELAALRTIEARGGNAAAARQTEQAARTAKARQSKKIKALDEKIRANERKAVRAAKRSKHTASNPYKGGEHGFFRDLHAAGNGSAEARARLESRQSGTTQGDGFLPPDTYAAQWADVARTQAVVFNACPKIPLPAAGLTGYVPRWTTGSEAAVQTKTSGVNDDLAQADATPVVSDTLSADLVTVGATWAVDLQVLTRSRPAFDIAFGMDLTAAYFEALDAALVAGDGTNQTHVGLLHVAGAGTFDATAAASDQAIYRDLARAAADMYSARHALPTHLVVSPARALTLLSALSGTGGAPMASIAGTPVPGLGDDPTWPAGNILGCRLLVTDKLSDTEAILWRASDALIAVDDAVLYAYKQATSVADKLAVQLTAFGYSQAFLGRVPSSVMIISLPAIAW